MRKFYPVIHVREYTETLKNVDIATLCRADGCFLIHHGGDSDLLDEIYAKVQNEHPKLWIGLNYLGENNVDAANRLPKSAYGLWVDNLGINEYEDEHNQPEPKELDTTIKMGKSIFGGVAFKYQRQVEDIERAAKIARFYCDVVTTSGDATGSAASLSKIQIMYNAIKGYTELGLASGVTVDNVKSYLPYVNHFLVATGISKDFYNLDAYSTKKLADIIHGYQD